MNRPPRIYIAGAYSRRLELAGYADELRAMGYVITSRWLNGEHENQDGDIMDNPTLARQCEIEDSSDILAADWMIQFTTSAATPNQRGGQHVEFGIGLMCCSRVFIVGPRVNIFHWGGFVEQYDTWDAFSAKLTGVMA